VAQHGTTGNWHAIDGNGDPLQVTSTGNGLEIRRADSKGDANAGAHGEMGLTDPLAADQNRIAARLAPGHGLGA
jgi:hypothetical protein